MFTRQPVSLLVVLILALGVVGGTTAVGATTGQLGDDPITLETTFDPAAPEPGDDLTISTSIMIDVSGAEADETVGWTVTYSAWEGFTITNASCADTPTTTCTATWEEGDEAVTFRGVVEDLTADPIAVDVTIEGTVDAEAEAVTATTCSQATLVPEDATPDAATPSPSTPCAGLEGTIEVTVVPPVVPTEEPTETPTEVPTETPTEIPTEVPTEVPTIEPTATPEPTVEPTATAEPTQEPTATSEPTEVPTEEPTATTEPTVTATSEPTPTATTEPTATDEPTVTTEPTTEATSTVAPTAVEPTPTPDDDDGGSTIGLWIGVGALVVLAGAAGVVWNQRRNTV